MAIIVCFCHFLKKELLSAGAMFHCRYQIAATDFSICRIKILHEHFICTCIYSPVFSLSLSLFFYFPSHSFISTEFLREKKSLYCSLPDNTILELSRCHQQSNCASSSIRYEGGKKEKKNWLVLLFRSELVRKQPLNI
jgi:hypothetical protein